jgi:zinc protease
MTKNNFRAGLLPKPDDFDKINLDRSIQFYKERFANAGDFTFLFVGSFKEEDMKPLLEKYIGSLPGTSKHENFKDLGIRPPTGMIDTVINKGADYKSRVNIIFTLPAVYNPGEAYAIQSLAEVMNIKLIEKLREEKGGVYGVQVSGGMGRIPYSSFSFSISFPCSPDNVDTLSEAALEELKKIINNGVSAEDLEKIKEQQKRKLEVDMKQNIFWVNNLFEVYYYGSNAADILKKQKQIENLSSKMIQDVARKYIDFNHYIRVTLMPGPEAQKKAF